MDNCVGVGDNTVANQRSFETLSARINDTYHRLSDSIRRYEAMNDALTGAEPSDISNTKANPSPPANGLIYQALDDINELQRLCARLDNENNRLNKVISDG